MDRNIQNIMDAEVDPAQVDKLAGKNEMIKQKQLALMQNSVRRLGNFFSFVNEAKVTAYAERLQQKGVGAVSLHAACTRIIDNYEKFPPLKVIVELCGANQSYIPVDCSKCSGGGLVSLYNKKTGVNYAFGCECQNGSRYVNFIPVDSINLNLFTRHAPSRLGVDDPYAGWKESYGKFLNTVYRAKEIKNDKKY